MQINKPGLILFLTLATACAGAQSRGEERPAQASISSNYGKLPLTFDQAEPRKLHPQGVNRMTLAETVGLTVIGSNRRAKQFALLIALFLLVGALLFMSACAGGTGIAPQHQGTTPGTYTITVSGTSASLQHSVPLTLTVQ